MMIWMLNWAQYNPGIKLLPVMPCVSCVLDVSIVAIYTVAFVITIGDSMVQCVSAVMTVVITVLQQ